MIKVFKPNDTEYTSLGEKVIKPIEAIITKNSEEEYVELEAPLKYAEFLVQENILIIDTLTGKKGYRIHNPIKTDTIAVKAWLCFQENIPTSADRGAVIAHGKNLENTKISETWDDVVTKLIPVGYKKMSIPEGFLSVTHSFPRDYVKTIEFDLSEDLEEEVETLEETLSIMKSLETLHKNSVATLQAKYEAYDTSITSLNAEKVRLQQRLSELGTSEPELKEKAVIEAQLPLIDNDITSLTGEKGDTLAALNQAKTDRTKASQDVIDTTNQYNDLIINDLRTQAQLYLNVNQYPKISYDLEAHLDGIVEIGDTVRVKHPAMRVDLLTQVTEYKLDCLTLKFMEIKFGTAEITLKSKLKEIEEEIKSVAKEVNNANGTVSKYYSEYKRDNEEMVSKFVEELYGSVNGLFGMIEKSTSTIRQTAAEISGTVERVNASLSTDIAQIRIKADEITLKVQNNYIDLDGKIASNYSAITQTANQIRSEVSQTLKSYSTTVQMNSAITQSASSITSTVSIQINGVEEHISTVEQTANKISWLIKSGDSSANFTMTDRAVNLVAAAINLTGFVKFTDLSGSGTTEINGANIKTGTFSADKITSGSIDASKITVNNLNINNVLYGSYPVIDCTGSTSNPVIYIGRGGMGSYVMPSSLNLRGSTINIGETNTSLYAINIKAGSIAMITSKHGFYGTTPVTKQTVYKTYTASISLAMLADRFNKLLIALNTMGLIDASSTS